MNIRNNPLECKERNRFEWILNQRYKYLYQILGAYCEDGTLLWDLIENENHNSSTTINPDSDSTDNPNCSSTLDDSIVKIFFLIFFCFSFSTHQ